MAKPIRSTPDFAGASDDDAPAGTPWEAGSLSPSPEPVQASAVLGAAFALGAAPTAQLILALWSGGFRGFDRLSLKITAAAGALIGLFAFAGLAAGLMFGLRGVAAARRQGRSAALALAGAFLNFFAFWLWVGLAACWVAAMADWL